MGSKSAGAIRRRTSFRWLVDERLIGHNLIVGSGTLAAGVLGVAFQVIASHALRPADYGAVFVVITLMTFIGLPASAFTLLMARGASRDLASGQATSAALLQKGTRTLLLAGAVLGSFFALASPALGAFFQVPAPLLVAAAFAMPFALAGPLLMGAFQGAQRFVSFASLTTGQAALKIAGAVGLGYVFGPVGIIAGISLASVAIYLVAVVLLRQEFHITSGVDWLRPAARYIAVVLPSTLALAVLLSADVFLVKHFFATRVAGEYSAVAAIGRAIFWGAGGVATVMFPKIVFRRAQGSGGTQLLIASLAIVAIGGLLALGLLSIGSTWLLTAFGGAAYSGAARYLGWYAVGMTLLGGVAVMIAVHQSRGRAGFLLILIPLTLIEPALISILHQSLIQVIAVLDMSTAVILAGLAALYFAQEETQRLAREHPATAPIPTAASLTVNP